MHPIERLRYVARSGWAGPDAMAAEAAYALADLSEHEPAAVLPACRRLLEHNPACGPLWWVSARMLCASDLFAEADRCAELLEDDHSAQILEEQIAPAMRVVRHGTVAEVATADAVVIEVDSIGDSAMVVAGDDRGLLAAARALGVDIWVVAGVGRVLPSRLWEVVARLIDVDVLDGVTKIAGPLGLWPVADVLARPDCPEPPELLHGW